MHARRSHRLDWNPRNYALHAARVICFSSCSLQLQISPDETNLYFGFASSDVAKHSSMTLRPSDSPDPEKNGLDQQLQCVEQFRSYRFSLKSVATIFHYSAGCGLILRFFNPMSWKQYHGIGNIMVL